jgi:hypothetical protein
LWLVSSVDTSQAHINYTYSHPNLSQIKFLANLLTGFRGSGVSGGADTPDFASETLDFPEIPDSLQTFPTFKGI